MPRLALLVFLVLASVEAHAQTSPYAETLRRYRTKEPRGGRIYNGTKAKLADSPWQAALLIRGIDANFSAFFCGGTVLSDQWVLTAAHCVRTGDDEYVKPGSIEVLSGIILLKKEHDGLRKRVLEVIPHPDYGRFGHDCDIALLKVEGPLPGTPARLVASASDGPLPPIQVRVSGWGYLAWDPPEISPDLYYVDVPVNSRDTCKEAYPGEITLNMFCAGTKAADSCYGDSGGPVVTLGQNPRLVGVVSWGMPGPCKGPRGPGVYTRVASFLEWIGSKTGASLPR